MKKIILHYIEDIIFWIVSIGFIITIIVIEWEAFLLPIVYLIPFFIQLLRVSKKQIKYSNIQYVIGCFCFLLLVFLNVLFAGPDWIIKNPISWLFIIPTVIIIILLIIKNVRHHKLEASTINELQYQIGEIKKII